MKGSRGEIIADFAGDLVFSNAVRRFWQIRDQQIENQLRRGGSDQGTRSAVTGGKQMDGFVRKIIELMRESGVDEENIYTKKT
ncbi:PaeR7I family type II restriction endonuclease, partial [Methanocrinis sp.]|uniref:PaeR7I family type II restriction endonuclease n=1 Tax=Methanocrinis sp. TaxID=3101522 RepID=UPI003D13EE97